MITPRSNPSGTQTFDLDDWIVTVSNYDETSYTGNTTGNGDGGSVGGGSSSSSAGLHINLVWDASVSSAPAGFVTAVQTAASMLEAAYSDNITVNLSVGWGEIGGSPITQSHVAMGGPDYGVWVSYAGLKTYLANDAASADDNTVLASLPASLNPNGNGNIAVWAAQEKALGLISGTAAALDGEIGFSIDFPSSVWVAAALHELTHAMGRVAGYSPYGIEDLLRYSSPGVHHYAGGTTDNFSINGGNTVLAHFSPTSDYGDWASDGLTLNDPYNAFISSNSNALTAVDLLTMDVIGFNLANAVTATVIESAGSTTLSLVGNNYFLYANGTSSGPALKYANANVFPNEWGSWTPIGAEKTAGGYDIAWKNGSADQYVIWGTDNNGNWSADLMSPSSGSSSTLKSFETTFQQDLNGDGIIGGGSSTAVIESFGSTTLSLVGNNYFLYANGTSSGPPLKYSGANVYPNEWGAWTPIGAEQTASGYDVAWKDGSADQYVIWGTDNNGNWSADLMTPSSGSSSTLKSFETTFQQDLNGDGIIGGGSATTIIESSGVTSLTQVGANYFLYAQGSTSGPALKYGGSNVFPNEWGAWTPIGAEKTASGYDVAWKNGSADQYVIWGTDNNGNWSADLMAPSSGSSSTLKSFELTFQQDLNGNGVIGAAVSPGSADQHVSRGADNSGGWTTDFMAPSLGSFDSVFHQSHSHDGLWLV
jgi:serralysin